MDISGLPSPNIMLELSACDGDGITLLFILAELVVPVAVTVLYPSLLKPGLGACLP